MYPSITHTPPWKSTIPHCTHLLRNVAYTWFSLSQIPEWQMKITFVGNAPIHKQVFRSKRVPLIHVIARASLWYCRYRIAARISLPSLQNVAPPICPIFQPDEFLSNLSTMQMMYSWMSNEIPYACFAVISCNLQSPICFFLYCVIIVKQTACVSEPTCVWSTVTIIVWCVSAFYILRKSQSKFIELTKYLQEM